MIADAINCLKPKQVHYNPRLHRELFAEFVSDEHFERLRSVDDHCARQENSVAIIKLRYLLYLYPDADLLRTYDLLHNLDYKADLVAEELEKLGLKRADRRDAVTSPEMNSGKQHHSQSSMSHWNVMACDENFALPMPIHEQERRYGCLQNEHPDVDEQLIRMALKCSEFEMDQARQLLHMVNLHPQPNFIEQVPITSTRTSGMIYMTTRGTQTGYLIHYDFDRSQIYTKNKSRMLCKDVAVQTLVSSDHSSQFPSKSTISTGPIASNRMGPTVRAK